jgi:putative ABC transport system permease protein
VNLALRDIRRHKTRFALTCAGLGLLLTVVMAMSGIYRGLIGDATKVIDAIPGQLWVVQKDTRGPFAESSRLPEDLEFAVSAVDGVRSATPVSFQYVEIARNGRPVRLFLVGTKAPARFGAAHIVAGRPIMRKHYELVADQKAGLQLRDRIRLGREDFTVVGLTRGMPSPSGDPLAFVSLADAQEIQFQTSNDAIRNSRERVMQSFERLGLVNPLMRVRASDTALEAAANVHFANAVVADLSPAGSINDVSRAIRRWNHYEVYSADAQRALLLQGLVEKSKKQLWLFRAILVLVSGVIVALIIYTMTLDKLREIATLKIIGAADRTIAAMILQQALLLGVIGYAIAFALINKTHASFPRTVTLERMDMIVLFAIVIVICTVASLLGIRRAMSVDPATALMGGS